MASFVGAVGVSIASFAALVALANNIIRNPLPTAMVKNKIFPDKFILKPQIFNLPRIFNNAALQLKYIFKTFVFVICTGLFTPDSSRTVHHQFFIFFVV